jgi:hypothetical protein
MPIVQFLRKKRCLIILNIVKAFLFQSVFCKNRVLKKEKNDPYER